MIYTGTYISPLGGITLAGNNECLTGLWFDGQKYFADTLAEEYENRETPVFSETRKWLDKYFSGKDPGFTPPLYLSSSLFRMEVWEILKLIPYGKVMTYGEIAAQIAKNRGISAMSAQAVGGAVGRNPISLIIPCHRVVGNNGSLTGYAGGIDKKLKLLKLEKVNTEHMFIPKKGTAL